MNDNTDYWQQQSLEQERQQRAIAAISEAARLGVADENLRTLLAECGLKWQDISQLNAN